MNRRKKTALLMLVSLCAASLALATPEDRNKPITGKADTNTMDANSGKTVLIGQVVITQGALIIYADKVTIETDPVSDQLSYLLAEGKPVRLFDQPVADGEMVQVQGLRVEFFPNENKIITLGQAQVTQVGNKAEGERIIYLTDTGVMTIESERAITGQPGGKQAELLIQPEAVN
ncbi:lipopolysaccharide transport periplasmic protein LptA [Reinekea forsetii]|jgi:lipopolysaccharide export system protein LptA|uniref:LptA, protein essential for LPS transport across the periplasm n=1 Tax=Reinekea forsetii TaxID=1336806 RepID=A0A2K8KS29_9GAMM|nr:lipopolysaccharide transport periplasmic protein LptA [Reinekea forsetii]ATX77513.1 LptA, protein essential for LPS transport across the periplasm [Reinekea forsetii]MDO7640325.1 lipopolysaccharide transport periplasmic protein LptA [Reinekea forsetii]MDO7645329.1 lipopolysaccharide transport periplasmic protein LptA [Reinekea forsetii]